MATKYDNLRWTDQCGKMYHLDEMSRQQIRDTLQYCVGRGNARFYPDGPFATVEGLTFPEWSSIFFVKLLDPELPE